MYKEKAMTLKKLAESEKFLSLSFQDLLSLESRVALIEDLVFLTGYSYIETTESESDVFVFKAGMTLEDLDVKLNLKNNCIEGKLVSGIETTFSVLQDISRQSNILDLYPQSMRREMNDKILKSNNINSFSLSQLNFRLTR